MTARRVGWFRLNRRRHQSLLLHLGSTPRAGPPHRNPEQQYDWNGDRMKKSTSLRGFSAYRIWAQLPSIEISYLPDILMFGAGIALFYGVLVVGRTWLGPLRRRWKSRAVRWRWCPMRDIRSYGSRLRMY